MWVLNNIKTGEKFYLLQSKEKYTVTRTAGSGYGHLVLSGDLSISRIHAHLYPTKEHIKITDCSKYGTYVNANISINVPLEPNREHLLNAQDRIRFGRFENQWVVQHCPITIITSTLSETEKSVVKRYIVALDGVNVEQFSENCTHLTVRSLTATMKVLQSLAYAIPIVTPAFWKSYLNAIRNGTTIPNPDTYSPTISEPYMFQELSIGVNVNRRRLFAGKTFVFMVKKHQEFFESLIQLAGGKSIISTIQTRKSFLKSPNVIMVHYHSSTQSKLVQTMAAFAEYLSAAGLRVIPDCEIGLAIIHCSTVEFCNPMHKTEHKFDVLSGPPPWQIAAAAKVLAENTPSTSSRSTYVSGGASNINIDKVLESIDYESVSAESSNKMVSDDFSVAETPTEKASSNHFDDSDEEQPVAREPKRKHSGEVSEYERPPKKAVTNAVPSQVLESMDYESVSAESSNKMASDDFGVAETPTGKASLNLFDDSDKEQPVAREPPTTTTETKRNHSGEVSEYERPPKKAVTNAVPSPLVQNTLGWQSKNMIQSQMSQQTEAIAVEPTGRKRAYNLLEDDNGDENENLFQFNVKTLTKNRVQQSENNDDADKDNIFKFPTNISVQSAAGSSQLKQAAVRNLSVISKTPTSLCRPIEPLSMSKNGWLSRSFKKTLKLNDETWADDTTPDWIKSIRNGFQVKVVSMNLTTRSIDRNVCNNKTVSGQPNFKAFVKKMNYKPQTTVIKTGIVK